MTDEIDNSEEEKKNRIFKVQEELKQDIKESFKAIDSAYINLRSKVSSSIQSHCSQYDVFSAVTDSSKVIPLDPADEETSAGPKQTIPLMVHNDYLSQHSEKVDAYNSWVDKYMEPMIQAGDYRHMQMRMFQLELNDWFHVCNYSKSQLLVDWQYNWWVRKVIVIE